MSKVRWIVVYGFVANYTLSSSGKKIENRFRFDKITESLKVGTFSLRHMTFKCRLKLHFLAFMLVLFYSFFIVYYGLPSSVRASEF